jgi:Tfp pilus assembly protein PilN
VRPVNLLPAKHRPRTASGQRQGSSYYVLGGLGVVLLALVVYVMTLNSINSKRDGIAKANADATQAQARAGQLSAYGNFAQVKNQRVQSIKQLAQGRVDWELLTRELSHVMPDGVWVKTINASTNDATASQNAATGAGTSSTAASGSGSGGASSPTVQLDGCAASQQSVATLLVRLRQLHGAGEVSVEKSDRPDDSSAGGGGGGSASSTDCGSTHGELNYAFTVDVALSPTLAQDDADAKVPASLGGGS